LILFGLALLVFFAYYETHISSIPLLPPRLLKNKTIVGGSALGFFHFCSQFCYESFFTSFLQYVAQLDDSFLPLTEISLSSKQSRPRSFSSRRFLHQVSFLSFLVCYGMRRLTFFLAFQSILYLCCLCRSYRRWFFCQNDKSLQMDRNRWSPDPCCRSLAHDEIEESERVNLRTCLESVDWWSRRRIYDDCCSNRLSKCSRPSR